VVINTTGPWVSDVFGNQLKERVKQAGLAKAVNLVVRPLFNGKAVGLMGQNNLRDRDALVDKGSSFLFIAPWRGKSILGTAYSPFQGDPDSLNFSRKDIQELLASFNQAYPAANLTESDVSLVHAGLLPASSLDPENASVDLEKHHRIYNHAKDGLPGLFSVMGVKYTTARRVGQEVLDQVFQSWHMEKKSSPTGCIPLFGGKIDKFDSFLQNIVDQQPCGLGKKSLHNLAYNYGMEYERVLDQIDPAWQNKGISEDRAVFLAEVRHALQDEMAQKLSDVVLRRTELGSAERPAQDLLAAASAEMGAVLGWSTEREQSEIEEVNEIYNFAG
jgi:glycerol-3-phosphate dehydrogenase